MDLGMYNVYINRLTVLGILMITNIILGLANSMAVQKFKFDKSRFFSGICKAIASGIGIIVLAYAFSNVDTSGLGISPMTILSTAILTYIVKCTGNITRCLGISNTMNKVLPNYKIDDSTGIIINEDGSLG